MHELRTLCERCAVMNTSSITDLAQAFPVEGHPREHIDHDGSTPRILDMLGRVPTTSSSTRRTPTGRRIWGAVTGTSATSRKRW